MFRTWNFAQLVKLYGPTIAAPGRYSPAECTGVKKIRVEGNPDIKHVSTSYVKRQNLTMRCLPALPVPDCADC